MSHPATAIEYRELEPTQLELIRPLWEKLKAFHLPLSPRLAARRSARTFDMRREQFLAKSTNGKLRVDAVFAESSQLPLAFCVSSLSPEGTGEIDALFVEKEYRGTGIGTRLVQRALAWLDELSAETKVIVVACGNDAALEFYQRLGFETDSLTMRQTPPIKAETNP